PAGGSDPGGVGQLLGPGGPACRGRPSTQARNLAPGRPGAARIHPRRADLGRSRAGRLVAGLVGAGRGARRAPCRIRRNRCAHHGLPCAMGIAAPLAIVRAAGEAADRGIIMRTGEAFQTFGQIRTIVLDKTGTLTQGAPAVREVEACTDEADLLATAAAAEDPSEHPLARAIVTAAATCGLSVPAARDFASVTGFGVTATVGGRTVVVGKPGFLADRGIELTPVTATIQRL